MGDEAYKKFSTLYVGDLCRDVSEEELKGIFSENGRRVHSVRIIEPKGQRIFNYAFVNFLDYFDAQSAKEELNLRIINGYPIRVMWKQFYLSPFTTGIGNICISNLREGVNPKELYKLFSSYGKISSCKVNRSFGFVQYEHVLAAEQAISSMHGKLYKGKHLCVKKTRHEVGQVIYKDDFYNKYHYGAPKNSFDGYQGADNRTVNYPTTNGQQFMGQLYGYETGIYQYQGADNRIVYYPTANVAPTTDGHRFMDQFYGYGIGMHQISRSKFSSSSNENSKGSY